LGQQLIWIELTEACGSQDWDVEGVIMKSDKGKKIEITEERFRMFVENEHELRKLQSDQDESAGSKKFGAFVFYSLTVWGVSLDQDRYAMIFAILGPAWVYVIDTLGKLNDRFGLIEQKIIVFFAFISVIIIGLFSVRLDPNGSSVTYFYTFAFSAIGTGLLPLKKSQSWKN
jgi:hypothetical protein